MQIKVDYSIDCKQHGYDTSRPGCYAIYTRKHFWNSWIQGDTFADINWCKRTAFEMSKLPIMYRRF